MVEAPAEIMIGFFFAAMYRNKGKLDMSAEGNRKVEHSHHAEGKILAVWPPESA